MDVKELIQNYLGTTRMLQIATCVNSQPWVCTVYYAFDEKMNIYWISTLDTRHSKEIGINPKVACSITFSQEPYPTDGVRGLQFEGEAKLLSGDEEIKASILYIEQLNREKSLLEDIRSGKNPHKFYSIRPIKFVLFDSVTYPDDSRQEYIP
jgi:uncharacterized protein YhbP (UPF0306 family)